MWFSRQVSAYLQWLDQDLGQVPLPTFPPPFCAESIFILNLQGHIPIAHIPIAQKAQSSILNGDLGPWPCMQV